VGAIIKRILFALTALALVLWLIPSPQAIPPVRDDRMALGTLVTIKLYGEEEQLRPLFAGAYAEFARVDSLMSRYRADGELAQIERAAPGQVIACSRELFEVLERSLYWAQESAGAFDPTVGPLTRLWNFPDVDALPDSAAVEAALAQVGYEALQIEAGGVRLAHAGIHLDLGAAAKGYAVDRAVAYLQAAGVEAGLIEAGGDIRYWGAKPDGSDWRFGVQHPRNPQKFFEVEDIGLVAIATSGDYEQYFEWNGLRYHHILDPASGWPARGAISATIWAQTAMDADILATAVFVLGPERGLEMAEKWPDVEALIFTEGADGLQSRATSGIESRFRFVD
jgi:thiamine biosynthesis lipoprotein